nr:hypothetical protein [Tanacetum cinerariifolium]
MDTRKSVLDLEAFREMLHISPRIPSQSFAELPSEEEILDFLRFLGHSDEIRHLTDVNAVPKPKASARKKKGGSASSIPPPIPIATPTPTATVGREESEGDKTDESDDGSDDGNDDDNHETVKAGYERDEDDDDNDYEEELV